MVEGSLSGVGKGALAEGVKHLQLVAVVVSADLGLLTTHEGHLLSVLELLGNNTAQTTHQMSAHVDHGRLGLRRGGGVLSHF